ncbi:hypothetical protein PHA51_06635 [Rodentibacter pneumotropicus]|uniref:Uncharacterized protein n=1 Tax=Rodentibacter pneumotropicus TaxID=758 RepID=A0A4S2PQA0_9PAST|nr:hypothetical protein [Rodentibacter pneumotropicus]MDC2825713.1 hypothetical protein [Rodentibacter pneumotropicus]THA05862.1 hypothetical protein D3M78_11485 [Rodentibacter pneumotropicus]
MSRPSKKRKILTALLAGVLAFIALLACGVAFVTYLPGVNLNDWFRTTANYWLLFRLFVYMGVGILLYFLQRSSSPLPRKVIVFIVLAFALNEGLNLLYRL